ncbi:MAG TPA: GWxTD domain-containing protein [Terriglobia bacterium]|nr:GWxTD domain-containing protein [Terriglobia bacterium]
MSRRGTVLTLTAFLLCSLLTVLGQSNKDKEQARQKEEGGNYLKKWPEESVPYIIDPQEEKAFKGLRTDEERENFIEQFWLRRDPTPDTTDNEYRDDYYRRIAIANEKYTSGIPGWKTDRGRILIMHGEPDEIETHGMGGTYIRPIEEGGGRTSTFPFEKWRYRYVEGIGNEVILEFVDTSMSGEYRLTFDPVEKDALLYVPGMGLTEYEERNGLDKADRLNRPHAKAGNPMGQDVRTSDFDRLDTYYKILTPPAVKFKDLERIVNSRLSYNALPFDYRADVYKMTELASQVPITVQIAYKNLTFKEETTAAGNKSMHATGRIEGRIQKLSGRVVDRIDDPIEINIPIAQFRPDGHAVYQRVLNLAPGAYSLFLVVNDAKSNNSGTLEKRLEVKRFLDGNLASSSLVLADLLEVLPPRAVANQFQVGSLKVRPSVKREFQRTQTMSVFMQLYGLKVDEKTHKPSLTSEVLITRDGQEIKKLTDEAFEVVGAAQQVNFIKQIPVSELEPGQYAIQVKIMDNLAQTPLVSSDKFTVR